MDAREFGKMKANPAELIVTDSASPLAGQRIGLIVCHANIEHEIKRIGLIPVKFPKNASDKLKLEVLSMQLGVTLLAQMAFDRLKTENDGLKTENDGLKIENEVLRKGQKEWMEMVEEAVGNEQDAGEIDEQVIGQFNLLRSG